MQVAIHSKKSLKIGTQILAWTRVQWKIQALENRGANIGNVKANFNSDFLVEYIYSGKYWDKLKVYLDSQESEWLLSFADSIKE